MSGLTDRELLEGAARAAGMPPEWRGNIKIETDHNPRYWNPLEDDGDALRLAVKLRMNIEVTESDVYACAQGNFSEPVKSCANAAARRAIVRAAYEIGSAMP